MQKPGVALTDTGHRARKVIAAAASGELALADREKILKNINEIKNNKEMMMGLVKNLQYNTGLSLRRIAQLLAMNREDTAKKHVHSPVPMTVPMTWREEMWAQKK